MNLLTSWGGPGRGYAWPQSPGGLAVDAKGNVWITAAGLERHRRPARVDAAMPTAAEAAGRGAGTRARARSTAAARRTRTC